MTAPLRFPGDQNQGSHNESSRDWWYQRPLIPVLGSISSKQRLSLSSDWFRPGGTREPRATAQERGAAEMHSSVTVCSGIPFGMRLLSSGQVKSGRRAARPERAPSVAQAPIYHGAFDGIFLLEELHSQTLRTLRQGL